MKGTLASTSSYIFFLGIALSFSWGNMSCSGALERENVDIWGGTVMDNSCSLEILLHNIQSYKRYQLSGWMIEVPFYITQNPHTSDFRYYETSLLDTLMPLLKRNNIRYGFYFSLHNPNRLSTRKVNISDYFTDISGILLRAEDYPPSRIGFGEGFLDKELIEDALPRFVFQIKLEFPSFEGKIVYGSSPDDLAKNFDYDTPDIIGIVYPPPVDESHKRRFKKINLNISKEVLDKEKPVMILQTNLLGKDKYHQFVNELRFWEDEVQLESMVINTDYCDLPFHPDAGQYSISKESRLLSYLAKYTFE